MLNTRQLDIKTQYIPKRKTTQQYSYEAKHSHNQTEHNRIQNNSIQKPLQDGVKTPISFKGLQINTLASSLKPVISPIPRRLTTKVFESLEKVNKEQYKYYTKIVNDYVDYIKNNPSFRKKNGISDALAQNLSKDNLIYLPKKRLVSNFVTQVVAPFKFIYNSAQKLILSKEKLENIAKERKILKDFASFEGLAKSHEIWENGYRKMSGNSKWSVNSEFLIPDDVLLSKIKRRRNKVVDPNKGKYSATSLMLGNRFISGIVYSYFLGTDAYNTTMRYSNDRHEASTQRNSRVAQEFSRIGLNLYIQNLLFGTFERMVNKSLSTALLVSGSTVAFSEILGRKLVGKPVMPSDKATLDKMEAEMQEKKGVLPAIGRLLTNVKKKQPALAAKSDNKSDVAYKKTEANKSVYSAFSKKSKEKTSSNIPSFKGYYEVEKLLDKKKLQTLLNIVEKVDTQEAKSLNSSVLKALAKSKIFKDFMNNLREKDIESFKKLESLRNENNAQEFLKEIFGLQSFDKIPMGNKKTVWGQLTKSFMVPIHFVIDLTKSFGKSVQRFFESLTGKTKNHVVIEYNKLLKSGNDKEIEAFNNFYSKRINMPAWKYSKLNDSEKVYRIFEEFKSIQGKDREEIEGAKNIILWLDKQIKRAGIKIQPDGTLNEKDLEKVKKIMRDSVLTADASKHVEYDGNVFSQTNINLSRAITTLFLVTDAYNLTMQYSNDNKKEAAASAKNRTAQELSRIGVSAYILAFVHNLLSRLCNSSLGGAFTLTALTSVINDSLSRKVVGVPLTAKSQSELLALDEKNKKSKSPIKKALAYSIGKKGAAPQPAVKKLTNTSQVNYFDGDFFIKPEIN